MCPSMRMRVEESFNVSCAEFKLYEKSVLSDKSSTRCCPKELDPEVAEYRVFIDYTQVIIGFCLIIIVLKL